MAFVPSTFSGRHQAVSNTQRFVFGEDWFDPEELRQLISQQSSPQLFASPSIAKTRRPDQVHVILFNPHSQNEGMHTIEDSTGTNVILAFEDAKDCNVFSEHLKAQQFHDPTVRSGCFLGRVCILFQF